MQLDSRNSSAGSKADSEAQGLEVAEEVRSVEDLEVDRGPVPAVVVEAIAAPQTQPSARSEFFDKFAHTSVPVVVDEATAVEEPPAPQLGHEEDDGKTMVMSTKGSLLTRGLCVYNDFIRCASADKVSVHDVVFAAECEELQSARIPAGTRGTVQTVGEDGGCGVLWEISDRVADGEESEKHIVTRTAAEMLERQASSRSRRESDDEFTVTVTSVTHERQTSGSKGNTSDEGNYGDKCFFDPDELSAMLGVESQSNKSREWSGRSYPVMQMRGTVPIWCGMVKVVRAGSSAYGQREYEPGNGQWEVGDIIRNTILKKCQWMYADATSGLLGMKKFASYNPLRWSGAIYLNVAISEIEHARTVKDKLTLGRPVTLKIPPGRDSAEVVYASCEEAIHHLKLVELDT